MMLSCLKNKSCHFTTWYFEFPQPKIVGYIKNSDGSYDIHFFKFYLIISETISYNKNDSSGEVNNGQPVNSIENFSSSTPHV
jgi:hypothetical protein